MSDEWKTVKYGNDEQTGPVSAIDEVITDLEAEEIDYTEQPYDTTPIPDESN